MKSYYQLLPLTSYQVMVRRIENDARNIRNILNPLEHSAPSLHAVVIADCALRFFQAREIDKQHGGNELERRAELITGLGGLGAWGGY